MLLYQFLNAKQHIKPKNTKELFGCTQTRFTCPVPRPASDFPRPTPPLAFCSRGANIITMHLFAHSHLAKQTVFTLWSILGSVPHGPLTYRSDLLIIKCSFTDFQQIVLIFTAAADIAGRLWSFVNKPRDRPVIHKVHGMAFEGGAWVRLVITL